MLMIIAGLTVLGLSLGSFINALVWRLRQQENNQQKTINKKQYSVLNGRSMCPHCKHKLSSKDLVPLVSWFFLKGKCRYCKKPISAQYPLVEVSTAGLFILSYIYWPEGEITGLSLVNFTLWLAILTGLIALIIYDFRWMILPNKIIFPLYGLVITSILIGTISSNSFELIISSLWGVLIGGGIFYILFQISDGRWIGGGDVKLGFLLGAIIGGPLPAFLMLFLASFLGSVFSVPIILKKRLGTKTKIAFGPFLIISALITFFAGESIIELYNNLLML